ncbi:c-5 sterol desaturase [Entomortierella beljakovae]|nr:c-5 sterol desaturase [Entomortierella beljakovae]
MDVVLDLFDEYVFNSVYTKLPAIPIPDLVAGLASIPKWSDFNNLMNSGPSPMDTISTIGRNNQIKQEIQMSMKALPGMAFLTIPWLVGEVRGWSQLYAHIHAKDAILSSSALNPPTSALQQAVAAAVQSGVNSTAAASAAAATAAANTAASAAKFGPFASIVAPFMDGWGYVAVSAVAFLMFTDFGIYWIHRWLHHPLIYKRIHKPHHKWIVPTPFASHAFHFIDGYSQSVPYHLFVYIFPMQKFVYLIMFTFVNFWSVLIHDGEYLVDSPVVNSAAHHAVHHLYFNYNYGQYLTLWDRVGGSFRKPDQAMYDPSLRMDKSTWKKQAKDVDNFDDNGKPTANSDATYKQGPHAKDTKTLKTL